VSKINWNRLREKKWKPRVKLPPNRVIDPETVYNRKKTKDKLSKKLKEYQGVVYEDSL